MGHAHDEFLDPAELAVLHDGLESDDEGFAAFEREAFAAVFGVEEILERLGLVEFAQDFAMQGGVAAEGLVAMFQFFQNPVADVGMLDVHELGPDRAAVNALQILDHVAQRHFFAVAENAGGNGQVEVLLLEAQFLKGKQWVGAFENVERIEIRDGVSHVAVGIDQGFDAGLQIDFLAGLGRGRGTVGRADIGFAFGVAQFESFKKCRPVRIDRTRVGHPFSVIFFNQRLARAGGKSAIHEIS